MHDRTALGPADVDETTFASLVAGAVGADA